MVWRTSEIPSLPWSCKSKSKSLEIQKPSNALLLWNLIKNQKRNNYIWNELGFYIIYWESRKEHKNEQDVFKNSWVKSESSMKACWRVIFFYQQPMKKYLCWLEYVNHSSVNQIFNNKKTYNITMTTVTNRKGKR